MRKILRQSKTERGATLVEFAFIAPFLLLLLIGTVELGWALGVHNDARHGAREAARLAAVDAPNIQTGVCDSMDLSGGQIVDFDFITGSGNTGDTGGVSVTVPAGSMTGAPLIDWVIPPTINSTVEFRLERDASTWNDGTSFTCP